MEILTKLAPKTNSVNTVSLADHFFLRNLHCLNHHLRHFDVFDTSEYFVSHIYADCKQCSLATVRNFENILCLRDQQKTKPTECIRLVK